MKSCGIKQIINKVYNVNYLGCLIIKLMICDAFGVANDTNVYRPSPWYACLPTIRIKKTRYDNRYVPITIFCLVHCLDF